MATAAPSLDQQMSSGLSMLQKDIGAAKSDIANVGQQEQQVEDTAYKSFKGNLDTLASSFHQLQEEGSKIKPFEPPQPKDPLKSYGATVAGLLGIVGALTGKPMTDALNAGAAAINAARANNSEEYDRAFDAWKTNTDFAFKRMEWENGQLRSMLELANTDYNGAAAHIKSLSSIAQDRALAVTLDSQGIEGVSKLLDARIRGQQAMDQHSQALIDLDVKKRQVDLFKEWMQKNSNATPEQKAMALHQFTSPYSTSAATMTATSKEELFDRLKQEAVTKNGGKPLTASEEAAIRQQVETAFKGSSPITGNEKVKLQGRVDMFDLSLDKIDESIATLDKYILAAGITGRARRLGESVSNILGSNETDLTQFRRNLEYLQTNGSRLLTGTDGRPLSKDAAKVEDIIGGLSIGDTTANTKRALESVRDLYHKQRENTLSQLQGNWTPGEPGGAPSPSTPGAKPMAPKNPWENAPVVSR